MVDALTFMAVRELKFTLKSSKSYAPGVYYMNNLTYSVAVRYKCI